MKRNLVMAVLLAAWIGSLLACAPGPIASSPVATPIPVTLPAKPEPATAESLLTAAHAALEKQDDRKAFRLFGDYLTRFPRDARVAEALMQRGMLAESFGDAAGAIDAYQRIISESPHSVWAGDSYMKMLTLLAAEQDFDRIIDTAPDALDAIKTVPERAQIYRLLGNAYLARAMNSDAAVAYAEAYNLSPDAERPEMEEALETAVAPLSLADLEGLTERLDSGPARGSLLFLLGNRLMVAEEYVDARRILSEFSDRFPDDPRAISARETIADIEEMTLTRKTIGCLFPLSGPYAQFGLQALNGVEYALNQFTAGAGNPSVRIIVKDTGADPEKAVAAFQALADADVSAIIGPMVTAAIVAEKAQELGIPMIAMTQKEGIPQTGDYVFRNFITPRIQTAALAGYAINTLGIHRFAVLYPAEKYGITFMHEFWDQVAAYGGKLTQIEAYTPDQTDFADAIKKLIKQYKKGKNKDTRAVVDFDAIFIPDGSERAGLLIPQLAYQDIRDIYLLGTNLWYSPALIDMARSFVQGSILPVGFFPESAMPAVAGFAVGFENDFGKKPGFIEAVAYDTAMILFQVTNRPGMTYRSDVRDALLAVSAYPGLTGTTTFLPDGDVDKKIQLLEIKGDQFLEVTP